MENNLTPHTSSDLLPAQDGRPKIRLAKNNFYLLLVIYKKLMKYISMKIN